MAGSYKTGGPAPGKSASLLPGEDAMDCDVYRASMGNNQGVNTKDNASPGGYGSSGTASKSTPKGMKKSSY